MPVLRKQLATSFAEIQEAIEERLGYPCFVKPANLGSSVGVSKVKKTGTSCGGRWTRRPAIDRRSIVEKAAEGYREVECSVLGNDEPETSICGEIVPGGEFYDYEAKYFDDTSEITSRPAFPSGGRPGEGAGGRVLSAPSMLRAWPGSTFSSEQETEQIFVNEINTMPGFTRISMYPKLWEATGLTIQNWSIG